ncbi:MAG: hypothetical protein ABIA11_01240, partial [Patescibacteria group bacterium]
KVGTSRSGNWGHVGRPGQIGGSGGGGGRGGGETIARDYFSKVEKDFGVKASFKIVEEIDTSGDIIPLDGIVSGKYDPNSNTIFMRRDLVSKRDDFTKIGFDYKSTGLMGPKAIIAHELSHVKDGGYSRSESGTREFRKIFLDAKTKMLDGDLSHCVSRYAMTSESEHFAENSAVFHLNPSWLKMNYPVMHSTLTEVYSKDRDYFKGVGRGPVEFFINGEYVWSHEKQKFFGLSLIFKGGVGKDKVEPPTRDQLNRAGRIFEAIADPATMIGKAADSQMRGGVLSSNGRFTDFTDASKQRNLNVIVKELDKLKEKDPEAFELARQWDLAEKFGVKEYKDIPDEITVWRGHSEQESPGKVVNVTNKKEVAEKFGSSGVVTEYKMKKDDVFFSLSNSVFNEGELLVKGKSLKQISQKVSDEAGQRIEFDKWAKTISVGSEIKTKDGKVGKLVAVGVGSILVVDFPGARDYGFHFAEVKR